MFVDSFWTPDYATGLRALYGKLEQGVVENQEMLALAQARAEAEESYGVQLADIGKRVPRATGFGRDDGASMRQAYAGLVAEMAKEGKHHLQVSHNIRTLVLDPFGAWATEHEKRVAYSRNATMSKIKEYESNLQAVNKAQKRYFNKCRLLEEQREAESGESEGENENENAPDGPPPVETTSQELTLNGKLYTDKQVQDLFTRMLKEIPRADYKVPILGVYDNCSSGAEVVQWVQAHLAGDLQQVERIGQQLVDEGILRSVGQMGSRFANSSVLKYQWRPRAFELAGLSFNNTVVTSIMSSSLGERWQDYYGGDRDIGAEVRELDQKYRKAVVILDNTRSQLEELLVDHLRFLEKCELDRLKALKAVGLDLVAAQSNVVPSIQSSVDKQLLYQESMNPATDLRFIVEQYQTGPMLPNVTIYDNYYSSSDGTVFGMDLELRARGDGKPVPFIVSALLAQLDKLYPRLESDEVRLMLWTEPAVLKEVHGLRRELNFSATFDRSVLDNVNPQTIVGTLLLYLFQLPESVIPGQHYDVLKAIYRQSEGAERLHALRGVLKQLRVSNLATLDVISAHLNRLVSIAKPGPETLDKICRVVSGRLLRPRQYTAHTIGDGFGSEIVHDLVTNRDIFKELRSERVQPEPKAESKESKESKAEPKTEPKAEAEAEPKVDREPLESRISRIASRKSSKRPIKNSRESKELKEYRESKLKDPETKPESEPEPASTSPPPSITERLDELALEAESFDQSNY